MRSAPRALAMLLAACGHGGKPTATGGERLPDAGISNLVEIDAAPPDAPSMFPEMFAKDRDHPACDPRDPDRKNPNCCNGWEGCMAGENCFVEIAKSVKHIIYIDHGWNDGVIRRQHALLVDAEGRVLDRLTVLKAYADFALFSSDVYTIDDTMRVRMMWSCDPQWSYRL